MARDFLNYKKFIIQRIINPGLYWATEYEDRERYAEEIKQFESLLKEDVEEFSRSEITFGSIVAVKDETGFHRGLVTDIFRRDGKVSYCMLLVDHGKVIETSEKKIYFIKSKELKLKKSNATEISIRNIRPASLVLNCEQNCLNGIFQKRECKNWSSAAFEFVRNLLETDPIIFVKSFESKKGKFSGEIYFIQKSDGRIVSLGQKLCDEGFAIIRSAAPKLAFQDHLLKIADINIEEKIPENALLRKPQKSEEVVNQTLPTPTAVGTKGQDTCNLKDLAEKTGELEESLEGQNNPFSHLSSKTMLDERNFKSDIRLTKSSENSCSSSYILISSSPGELFKEQNICKTELGNVRSPEGPKINLFRIIQRNLKIFNEEKEKAAILGSN